MPLIDLPLPKLRRYRGRNPRPTDFDRYWREALHELDQTSPRAELVPNGTLSTESAECFDLWFDGVGGARLHGKYVRPREQAGAGRHRTVLMFHGYSANSGDWLPKLSYVGEGFCVAALDCRGQGGLSEDPGGVAGPTFHGHIVRGLADADPRKLYYRAQYLDTVQFARVIMARPEVDPRRVGVTGNSQGGGLTLACAALEPRIRRAAAVHPFLCDYQRVWELDLAKDAYGELTDFFRYFDPKHERQEEIFTRLGYIDVQHLAPRIKAEVLMFTGLMDAICPPSTQFAAFNRIRSRKEMVIYPDFRHEDMPGGADRAFNFMMGL